MFQIKGRWGENDGSPGSEKSIYIKASGKKESQFGEQRENLYWGAG